MIRRSVVVGAGSYLPEDIVTNHDLAARVDTSHEWIVERTGIHQRHIAKENEYTSDLASKASLVAIQNAGLKPDDIDLIIVATTTPDLTLPSTATKVQHMLGMKQGAAFDMNAACSGFVYALHVADALIVSGKAHRIVVVGAETYSRILDWSDRSTCILFGDGAGAVVLQGMEQEGTSADRGILFTAVHSDGEYGDILNSTGGISMTRSAGFITMSGKEVFRHAVDKMADITIKGLEKVGLSESDLNWLIPHQANWRIMASIAKRLNLNDNVVVSMVKDHANTSAASIPLALYEMVKKGSIIKGNLIAMPALGAGLTWGTCIIRW